MFETTSRTLMDIKEAAPTNATGSSIDNYDKYLFPGDTGLLTRDYQTPYGLKWGLSDVVPVKHLSLSDIDTMTNASKEYFNKMTAPKPQI